MGSYLSLVWSQNSGLKPIFQCNTKPLMLRVRVWQYPQHKTFALTIPTCWYPKSQWEALRPQRKALLTQREAWRTQCKPTEYSSRWVRKGWVCIGHVNSMLFLSISFALGSQWECNFQWDMDFGLILSNLHMFELGWRSVVHPMNACNLHQHVRSQIIDNENL